MNQLLVQDFLLTHTLKELQEQHGVYASFSKSGHKASFNYDMIETKDSDLLAQDCRGLILAAEDGHSFLDQIETINGRISYVNMVMGKTIILAFPFRRFFNYGQGISAVDFSDSNLSITTKMDGSLGIVYFDRFTQQWCIATRGVPEADQLMDNQIMTFRGLFERALLETTKKTFADFTSHLNKEITYCFEITSPLNRIVVRYDSARLTWLGARSVMYGTTIHQDPETGKVNDLIGLNELDITTLPSNGIPIVESHTYTELHKLIAWVATLNPMEQEGVVVRDSKYNRVKLKSAQYVLFSKLRDSLGSSERNCLELILHGQEDDSIPYLPQEIVANLLKIKEGLQLTIKDHDLAYETIYSECQVIKPNDKRTFAIALNGVAKFRHNKLWTAPLFSRYDGRATNMHNFIETNKKDGSWGNSFLDKLLELAKANMS